MSDYGSRVADRKISETNRRLRSTYRTAQKELKTKLSDFNRRFREKDAAKRRQLAEGKITKQDYKNWLTGQVFIRNQWESKVRQVSRTMMDCNRQSMRLINEGKLDVFAENYNYNAYRAERDIAISFNLYNAEAVARLIRDDPQVLPEWKIDEEKDYEWNYKKVNSIITQGIIQGESVEDITRRLCRDLATQNENRMRMFARTAITGAQNAGRQRQMEDAADMGIKVHKQWLSTMDGRTRDSHRYLDGQEVPYNDDFESYHGPIEYPGDPSADPAEIYNCRCTMVTIYPEYEDRSKRDWREDVEVDGESYEEWKEGKRWHGPVNERSYTKNNGLLGGEPDDTMVLDLQQFAERDLKKQSEAELRKGMKNLRERIEEHKKKIKTPEMLPAWDKMSEQQRKGTIKHWKKEMRTFEENIENRIEELKRRGLE